MHDQRFQVDAIADVLKALGRQRRPLDEEGHGTAAISTGRTAKQSTERSGECRLRTKPISNGYIENAKVRVEKIMRRRRETALTDV